MNILNTQGLSEKSIIDKTMPVLRAGGLVVFPTDTVYGLLVDAANHKAVRKLISFKERPAGKAISIFVYDITMMKRYVKVTTHQEARLLQLLPGPYTIVLPSLGLADHALEAENHTLGVRIPNYPLVTNLVYNYRHPLTATSANMSGKSPTHSISSLLNQFSRKKQDMIDLIVDAGSLLHNKPSTVMDFTDETVKILRQGDRVVGTQKKYITESEDETKMIAKEVLKEILSDYSSSGAKPNREGSSLKARTINKPIVFIIEGDLGVGKTRFVKGIGEALGIKNIISPTFVIYYEYSIKENVTPTTSGGGAGNKLVHFDLYKIQEANEFKHLGIDTYLNPGNILCFEWGEKIGEIYDVLKDKSKIIHVKMNYINDLKREILINI